MGTIDIGDPERGDPEDGGSTRARDPEQQAIFGELPISKNDRFASLLQGGSTIIQSTSTVGVASDMAIS